MPDCSSRSGGHEPLHGLEPYIDLTLLGINTLDVAGVNNFETITAQFIQGYYNNDVAGGESMSDLQRALCVVEVEINVTEMDPPAVEKVIDGNRGRKLPSRTTPHRQEQRRRRQRQLDDKSVTITYSQTITYRVQNNDTNPNTSSIVTDPFHDVSRRSLYVNSLRDAGAGPFAALQSVTLPKLQEEIVVVEPGISIRDDSINIWVIAGSVMGGLVVLFVAGGMYLSTKSYFFFKRGYRINQMQDINSGNSKIDPNAGAGSPHSTTETNKRSVVTIDHDYQNNHTGGTVSSSGGTIGDTCHKRFSGGISVLTGASILSPSGSASKADTLSIHTTDDDDVDNILDPGHPNHLPIRREDVFDIIAPPGKLGIGLDTPNSGAPVIYDIKEDCPIAGQLVVGDQIIFVDDEDVRSMTAVKASDLIRRKSANQTRKLTILRNTIR